mmetsp:Transcript_6619/g.10429  ORF Transcript_6619/g.10429 Transcript_6619/m.10429 type:complete len:91 (-) Transcript_6619:80-352(-)
MGLAVLGLELLGQAKVEELGEFRVARALALVPGSLAAITLGVGPAVETNVVGLDIAVDYSAIVMEVLQRGGDASDAIKTLRQLMLPLIQR